MTPLQIAVISDTHDHVPDGLCERLAGASEIWHLGDVTSPRTLEALWGLGVPMVIVRGNCDSHLAWPTTATLERAGRRFQLQHLPPRAAPAPSLDALLYGHLHHPQQEEWNGTRVLNPGSTSQPRGGCPASFAWIRFPPGGSWTWEIETL